MNIEVDFFTFVKLNSAVDCKPHDIEYLAYEEDKTLFEFGGPCFKFKVTKVICT